MNLVIAKFLEDITIMHPSRKGFLVFLSNRTYLIPRELASMLQKNGYCTYSERVGQGRSVQLSPR